VVFLVVVGAAIAASRLAYSNILRFAILDAVLLGWLDVRMLLGIVAASRRYTGTVVDQEEDWSGMMPIVAFTTTDGETVRFTSHHARPRELDAQVLVRCNARHPQRAWIDTFSGTWGWVILWLLVGPGVLLLVLVLDL
jgi:hypothetical protein